MIGAAAVVPLVACAVLALFRDSVANTNAALGLVLAHRGRGRHRNPSRWHRRRAVERRLVRLLPYEPYNSFKITDRADIETAVLLVPVGAAVSEVALWGYRQQARASREQG